MNISLLLRITACNVLFYKVLDSHAIVFILIAIFQFLYSKSLL